MEAQRYFFLAGHLMAMREGGEEEDAAMAAELQELRPHVEGMLR